MDLIAMELIRTLFELYVRLSMISLQRVGPLRTINRCRALLDRSLSELLIILRPKRALRERGLFTRAYQLIVVLMLIGGFFLIYYPHFRPWLLGRDLCCRFFQKILAFRLSGCLARLCLALVPLEQLLLPSLQLSVLKE